MHSSQFDSSPEAALHAIATHEGAVLVDLDETLYLHNSTEDFIGNAWPAPLAFFLIKLLELVRPWRFSGGAKTRDVWRVGVVIILMPWSLPAWRRAAARLGREGANARLVASLNAFRQRKAIVTLGFRPIVAPLVAAIGVRDAQLVAMSPWRFQDRQQGKKARVVQALGEAEVCNALLVTDSMDDQDLLESCRRPLRVIWPEAKYRDAFHGLYVPGLYISRVKRPGVRYIYRGIVSDEYSVWLLASAALATQPVLHVVGLALLSISFWAIYECGYVDNDLVGARHEKDPKLTRQFFENAVRPSAALPWVWAAGCGAVALLLLRWPLGPDAWDFLAWTAVLMVTFYWFRLYNRVDKRTRIWLFAGLQSLRSLSFVAVVSVTMVGAVALIAHVLARWVPYYSYRLTGNDFKDGEVGSSRLLFFVLISGGLMLVEGWEPFWSATGIALLAWFAFKARRELMRSCRNAHFITLRRPAPAKAGPGRHLVRRPN